MHPARVPSARFGPTNVVPEDVDRTCELERLWMQSGAVRTLIQIKTEKPRPRVRQVDITAHTAGAPRCMQGPPVLSVQGSAHTKTEARRALTPVNYQSAEYPRLGEVDDNPGLRILWARPPTYVAQ